MKVVIFLILINIIIISNGFNKGNLRVLSDSTDISHSTSSDSTSNDSTSSDSTVSDSTSNDSTSNDSTSNDSTSNDSTVSDSTSTDSTVSDTTSSDSTVSDSTVSDSTVSDTTSTDSTVSDSTVSDSTVSDSTVSDSTVSDTTSSDSTVSDTTVSDSTVSDSTVSDTTGSDSTGTDSTGSDSTGSDSTGTDSTGTDSTGTNSTGTDSTGTDASESNSNSTDIDFDMLVPETVVIGYDNYNYNPSSDLLSFFTYIRYYLMEPKDIIYIVISIFRNLRTLQDTNENLTCNIINKNSNDNIKKYECNKTIKGTISKIEVKDVKLNETYQLNKTILAEVMGNNLQNQKNNKISEKGIAAINNCEYTEENGIVKIKGTTNLSNGKGNLNLYIVQENGNIIEMPSTYTIEEGKIEISFNAENSKESINSNLNGTQGMIQGGENIYLYFNGEEKSQLDYQKASYNWNKNKKSSGGLSAGGIVAIIIPCVIVLLVAAGLAFFLGRKPPVPPNENLGNTIGVTSSSNVVN